jgi:hypothetical protein
VAGARQFTVVLFATAWMVSACVSVAPPAQTVLPVTLPTDPATQPTTATTATLPPVVEPTLEPAPTLEPEPPAEPEPTATTPVDEPGPPEPVARPNLRVLKFEVVQEPVLVDNAATLTADIINYADAAAGPFVVQFVVAQPGQEELILDTQSVEGGLAVGAATVLNVSITPDAAGELRLIARVDPIDQITEADESDNETVLTINVEESEINLTLPEGGLTVSSAQNPQAPTTYLFTVSLTNTGQSTMVGPMSVKYFGYNGAGDYVEWGTFDFDIDLAPGEPFNQQVAWDVDPGTYRAYALADSGETWAETNEEDNEAFVDFTAP